MSESGDWKQQVAEWRASGLSAEEFSKARGYRKTRLWAWSSRLLKAGRAAAGGGDGVRMVQIIRGRPREEAAMVTVHLHDARLVVAAGADRATLAMVLEAVDGLRRPVREGRG